MLPAVTTSVQATYLTGKWPADHGIVGNGWYDREDCEIKFWKQSGRLVQAETIWDKAKKLDPFFTCSKMFWWYNMYSGADYSVTPRPQYLSDGRKMPDCYSHPAELRDLLQRELGQFPLFNFWGPNANIKSTRWIADASMITDSRYDPTLTLIYLPHLDYCLQKYGPDPMRTAKELREVDNIVCDLVNFYEKKNAKIILLSEYGINAVDHPIHLNRVLRQHGLIALREERGLELLDPGASRAFAVADHQVAHIYINDRSVMKTVRNILENTAGIDMVLDRVGKQQYHVAHERAGDFIAVAAAKSWFTYYYWEDDAKAPDFARIVDIHRKPGYDPVEMFTDPADKLVMLKVAFRLLKKKLGFRYLMDVIPLDAGLVKGSHGSAAAPAEFHPVLITGNRPGSKELQAADVFVEIWNHLTA